MGTIQSSVNQLLDKGALITGYLDRTMHEDNQNAKATASAAVNHFNKIATEEGSTVMAKTPWEIESPQSRRGIVGAIKDQGKIKKGLKKIEDQINPKTGPAAQALTKRMRYNEEQRELAKEAEEADEQARFAEEEKTYYMWGAGAESAPVSTEKVEEAPVEEAPVVEAPVEEAPVVEEKVDVPEEKVNSPIITGNGKQIHVRSTSRNYGSSPLYDQNYVADPTAYMREQLNNYTRRGQAIARGGNAETADYIKERLQVKENQKKMQGGF